MSCEEIEISILDGQENLLTQARRAEVESHLAECAGCRMLARQLQELDAALTAKMQVPALSSGFARRLEERILAGPTEMSALERAERKRQLQAEFAESMAQVARGAFRWERIWRRLTWPTLAVLAGALAWRLTPHWTIHLTAQNEGSLPPNALPWLAASVVFVAVALAEARPLPWRVWRFW